MDFYGLDREKTLGNCDTLALGALDRGVATLSDWERVRPEHVIELLDKAAPEARGDARGLAQMLARQTWHIRAGSPARSDGQRLVSNVREIEIGVGGRNYRLHCTQTPSLLLERITA